ncbi:hypothetical protein HELRODRAFT_172520 [Helobdella robusta]|uniref:Uncharacterized protein n=1 Tax=Helobdella robusta TaxID=6412 RepID=T1F5G2_HELRO|nr:hypothetical protein HELRODRAFT_172520 [Helobdella robusta]ESO04177.1 hypothetical protein HELRODRAFT_172520 [Helobdella robusta]
MCLSDQPTQHGWMFLSKLVLHLLTIVVTNWAHFDYYLDVGSGLWYVQPMGKGTMWRVASFIASMYFQEQSLKLKAKLYKDIDLEIQTKEFYGCYYSSPVLEYGPTLYSTRFYNKNLCGWECSTEFEDHCDNLRTFVAVFGRMGCICICEIEDLTGASEAPKNDCSTTYPMAEALMDYHIVMGSTGTVPFRNFDTMTFFGCFQSKDKLIQVKPNDNENISYPIACGMECRMRGYTITSFRENPEKCFCGEVADLSVNRLNNTYCPRCKFTDFYFCGTVNYSSRSLYTTCRMGSYMYRGKCQNRCLCLKEVPCEIKTGRCPSNLCKLGYYGMQCNMEDFDYDLYKHYRETSGLQLAHFTCFIIIALLLFTAFAVLWTCKTSYNIYIRLPMEMKDLDIEIDSSRLLDVELEKGEMMKTSDTLQDEDDELKRLDREVEMAKRLKKKKTKKENAEKEDDDKKDDDGDGGDDGDGDE